MEDISNGKINLNVNSLIDSKSLTSVDVEDTSVVTRIDKETNHKVKDMDIMYDLAEGR